MSIASLNHAPVMLAEVLAALAPRAGSLYVDATFGAGGYSTALLQAASCRVLAIDQDPAACARGEATAQRFPGRLRIVQGRFGDLLALCAQIGIEHVDGVTFDLGVSSPQLDDAARGFSFRFDGPLDMRMDPHAPMTASDAVNTLGEVELADILFQLGEERASRRIAAAIVRARAIAPVDTTLQLAEIVRAVLPRSRDGIDPATRTFQALRIWVNDELGELNRGLLAAEQLLAPGGRLVVVSFHSLEDRIVKTFLRTRSGPAPRPSRHLPEAPAAKEAATFRLVTSRPLRPSSQEIHSNPRARSARLRAAERTGAPCPTTPQDVRRAA